MLIKRIAGGIASFVPGYNRLHRAGTGGTDSARYCYSIWLRHLVLAARHGGSGVPAAVAELGPGDSVGAGLAALLCGVERYSAFDVIRFATLERNLGILDELLVLFLSRAPIPDLAEFPASWPPLDDWSFPHDLLPAERLERTLADARVEGIRRALREVDRPGSLIRYEVPWDRGRALRPGSVDFVFSQAVLEHVADVPATWGAIATWLRPGGLASHTIDFRCHGLDARWDAHFTYPDVLWPLIRGNRPWLPNRQPFSRHIEALAAHGFDRLHALPRRTAPASPRLALAGSLRAMPEADRETDTAWVLARRR